MAVDRIRASAEYRLPENREYFERYMDVFESGEFYVERDELLEGTGFKRARVYFSGGIDLRQLEAFLLSQVNVRPWRLGLPLRRATAVEIAPARFVTRRVR